MNNFEEMNIQKLVKLYKMKKTYITEQNLIELSKLKSSFPELFIKENERKIFNLIEDLKYITSIPHFKDVMRKEQLTRLITIDFDTWKLGALNEELKNKPAIHYKDILNISRKLVQEALVLPWSIYQQRNKVVEISIFFPYLSILIISIIKLFPQTKQEKMLECSLFKMRGNLNNNSKNVSINLDKLFAFTELENTVKSGYQEMLDIVTKKFDARIGFYNDLCYFCLIYASDYIRLLAPHMNSEDRIENICDLIKTEISFITIRN